MDTAHMPLLRANVRTLMEKAVSAGVPPLAAGAALGMSAKTITLWLTCGMRCLEEPPKKPKLATKMEEFPNGRYIQAGDWYRHEIECAALAKTVIRCEGKMVAGLVRRMWRASAKNTDMMKFLFRSYQHVHGMAEPKQSVKLSTDEGEAKSGGLLLYLPHNGREDPVSKPVKKVAV